MKVNVESEVEFDGVLDGVAAYGAPAAGPPGQELATTRVAQADVPARQDSDSLGRVLADDAGADAPGGVSSADGGRFTVRRVPVIIKKKIGEKNQKCRHVLVFIVYW
jgi:hypothetical protein